MQERVEREERMSAAMSEQQTETGLDRKSLRGMDREVADMVLDLVNERGVRYRLQKNGVLLYPPDGRTPPYTVNIRNNQRQRRSLTKWIERYVPAETGVPQEALEALSERFTPPGRATTPPPPPEAAEHPVAGREAGYQSPEWTVYPGVNDDIEVGRWETNGNVYRCLICKDQGDEYITGDRTSLGGHTRMNHTDTSDLRTPEANAKRIDSRRYGALRNHVLSSIIELSKAIQVATPEDVLELNQKLTATQEEAATWRRRALDAEKRAEDANARLALMREALTDLDQGKP